MNNETYISKYSLESNECLIEYELVPIFQSSDYRSDDILGKIDYYDDLLEINEDLINSLRNDIKMYTSQADKLDYMMAASSGVLCGFVDAFLVGEFNFDEGKVWSDEKVNSFVVDIARKHGFSGNDLEGAIKYLEDNYKLASDNAWKVRGSHISPKSHRLDDWAHHPTPLGLLCSIIVQFTGKCFMQNHSGESFWLDANEDLIGATFSDKLYAGVHNWFMHLVSDMAGSSATAGGGMGIPGPFLALAKEFSAVLGFSPKKINYLFTVEKFDLRSEMAIMHQLGKQAKPVILNEIIVRVAYFIRRLYWELKEHKDVKKINFNNIKPWGNATVDRMLTVAHGAFCVIDLGDAAIRAMLKGGDISTMVTNFLLRINIVGICRFAVAIGKEFYYAYKRNTLNDLLDRAIIIRLSYLNAKLSYQDFGMWCVAKDTYNEFLRVQGMILSYSETYHRQEKRINDNLDRIDELLGC